MAEGELLEMKESLKQANIQIALLQAERDAANQKAQSARDKLKRSNLLEEVW